MHILFLLFGRDLICNDCLILVWWMAVCQGCVLWFHLELASSLWGSFSISAFKADHVWEWGMIRDGLMLCCTLRKSCFFWYLNFTNTNLSGEPRPSCPLQNVSPCLTLHLRLHGKEEGDICLFYSLLFSPPPFLFFASCLRSNMTLTPVCSAVTQNQCYVNSNSDINSHMKCTKARQA